MLSGFVQVNAQAEETPKRLSTLHDSSKYKTHFLTTPTYKCAA